jgi:hypothetical protein
MVFEVYTTYDYSFHYNGGYDVKQPPTSHNNVYYQRMQEQETPKPNIGSINQGKNGEAYYEFIYSPILPKPSASANEIKGNSILYYISKWCCCYSA